MDTNGAGGLAEVVQRMHRHRRHRRMAMWLPSGAAVAAGPPPGRIRAIDQLETRRRTR